MDHREHQFQSLGICNRVFNFIKFLPKNALKILTSGHLMPSRLAQARGLTAAQIQSCSNIGQVVFPIAIETPPQGGNIAMGPKSESDEANTHVPSSKGGKQASQVEENDVDNAISSPHAEEKESLEEEAPQPSNGLPKAPRKMVSINDNVETIRIRKKKNKKVEEKVAADDPTKPLKSILKVGSDLNNNTTESLLSRANGA